VGLNLLRLLVANRIAEFHTELELIPPEVRELQSIGGCLWRGPGQAGHYPQRFGRVDG
jgi:hypothetical protein